MPTTEPLPICSLMMQVGSQVLPILMYILSISSEIMPIALKIVMVVPHLLPVLPELSAVGSGTFIMRELLPVLTCPCRESLL